MRKQASRERKSVAGAELRAAGYQERKARIFRTWIFFERADITHLMRTAALATRAARRRAATRIAGRTRPNWPLLAAGIPDNDRRSKANGGMPR
jgi:hypothetical protein